MEWFCRKTNNQIEVFRYHGAYKLLEEPFCRVCGNLNVTTQECTWHETLYGFHRIYVMGKYLKVSRAETDLLSSHILMLKTNKEYAFPLGEALALMVQHCYTELLESELLVPVPLHLEEFRQRGYNQALEIARVLSERLDIPLSYVLEKIRTLNMRPLKWKDRREAVKGAYRLKNLRDYIQGKHVLLVDDVVTTGFTASECSDVLIKSGAKQVNVLALARTVL